MGYKKGMIKIDYFGRELTIRYDRWAYGGNERLTIIDRNNHHHQFFYRESEGGWVPSGAEPKWRKEFLPIFYQAINTMITP